MPLLLYPMYRLNRKFSDPHSRSGYSSMTWSLGQTCLCPLTSQSHPIPRHSETTPSSLCLQDDLSHRHVEERRLLLTWGLGQIWRTEIGTQIFHNAVHATYALLIPDPFRLFCKSLYLKSQVSHEHILSQSMTRREKLKLQATFCLAALSVLTNNLLHPPVWLLSTYNSKRVKPTKRNVFILLPLCQWVSAVRTNRFPQISFIPFMWGLG